jgi:hypothetical protein
MSGDNKIGPLSTHLRRLVAATTAWQDASQRVIAADAERAAVDDLLGAELDRLDALDPNATKLDYADHSRNAYRESLTDRRIAAAIDQSAARVLLSKCSVERDAAGAEVPHPASGDPRRITEQTTLGELAVQRVLLGVSALTLMRDNDGQLTAVVQSTSGLHIGQGGTEAAAIDAAFTSLRRATLPAPLRALIDEPRED